MSPSAHAFALLLKTRINSLLSVFILMSCSAVSVNELAEDMSYLGHNIDTLG